MKTYIVHCCICLICIMFVLTGTGYAQVPQKINYQGFLEDSMGIPVDGEIRMTFAIYDTATGGDSLWSETRTVEVDNGRYSLILGKIEPIGASYRALQIDAAGPLQTQVYSQRPSQASDPLRSHPIAVRLQRAVARPAVDDRRRGAPLQRCSAYESPMPMREIAGASRIARCDHA